MVFTVVFAAKILEGAIKTCELIHIYFFLDYYQLVLRSERRKKNII